VSTKRARPSRESPASGPPCRSRAARCSVASYPRARRARPDSSSFSHEVPSPFVRAAADRTQPELGILRALISDELVEAAPGVRILLLCHVASVGPSGPLPRDLSEPQLGGLHVSLLPAGWRSHVRARRAVDGGAAQDSVARGDAQQPRLPPGSHARAAHVELPQSRRQHRQGHGPGRHRHPQSGHRLSQARRVDGLVGERPDQEPVRVRSRAQGSGRDGPRT